ncbi:MAG: hypothetical protein KA713_20830 [Chryseotalea sp. WA131a]|jgi:hypothetical protein|nr:MAG: hypothetical protein KA713_20830 [Chryseotalea sp. WA131a]
MLEHARKIHLIEELLKVEDKSTLEQLEKVIKKSKKAQRISAKEKFLNELKASIEEVKLARKGKVTLQSAKAFLNEL